MRWKDEEASLVHLGGGGRLDPAARAVSRAAAGGAAGAVWWLDGGAARLDRRRGSWLGVGAGAGGDSRGGSLGDGDAGRLAILVGQGGGHSRQVAVVADWWWSWGKGLLSDGDGLGDGDDWAVGWWWRWWGNPGWLGWSLGPGLSAGGDVGGWDVSVCQPGGPVGGTRASRHRRAAWDELGNGRGDGGRVDSGDSLCRGLRDWWWWRMWVVGGWPGRLGAGRNHTRAGTLAGALASRAA